MPARQRSRNARANAVPLLIDEVPPDLQVDADPEQLFRIVLNLLRNAEQAVNGSGSAKFVFPLRAMAGAC